MPSEGGGEIVGGVRQNMHMCLSDDGIRITVDTAWGQIQTTVDMWVLWKLVLLPIGKEIMFNTPSLWKVKKTREKGCEELIFLFSQNKVIFPKSIRLIEVSNIFTKGVVSMKIDSKIEGTRLTILKVGDLFEVIGHCHGSSDRKVLLTAEQMTKIANLNLYQKYPVNKPILEQVQVTMQAHDPVTQWWSFDAYTVKVYLRDFSTAWKTLSTQ